MQAVSNLWAEESEWLMLRDPGVTEIFAIAVDPLTENIFYIIPEPGDTLATILNTGNAALDVGDGVVRTKQEVSDFVKEKVRSTFERLMRTGKTYGPIREENISIQDGVVLLENRLLLKPSRETGGKDRWEEHQQNLQDLDTILESVLK